MAIRGVHIPEERRLAGRIAGTLYLTGVVTGLVLIVVPGVPVGNPLAVVGVPFLGAVWGIAALAVVPWERTPALVSWLSTGAGAVIAAVEMAQTGGSTSPARFYLLFIVFFVSWFYPPREAFGFIVLCVGVHALPLAYEADALSSGFVAELVVLGPTYVVIGGLIVASKAQLSGLREESRSLSLTDPLTGLANRRRFQDRMARLTAPAERESDTLGLLLVDLDDFKAANTLFGHSGGDRVLVRAAVALRGAVRETDMVARLGGDEFAIVAPGAGEEEMRELSRRILASIALADADAGAPGFRLSASLGWAIYPRHARSADALIESADLALGEAKASGKACSHASPDGAQRTSRRPPVSTS